MNSFLATYGIDGGDFTTSQTDDSAIHFWEASFIRETLTDASQLTGKWKRNISETYYRYENTHSADRFGNPNSWIGNDTDWNDDYSWATQFALDAYEATGDMHMRDQARWHFDFFYQDYYDDVYGGGFWRERGTQDQKDVPSNGFAIAAAELARYYPDATVHNNPLNTDKTYLQIAQDTYNWLKTSFMRPDGGFENSFSGRSWDDNLYTYNAGVFLELAANLYNLTKDQTYITDGIRVADFAKSHFTTGDKQLLVYEDDVNGNGLYRPDPVDNYEIVFKGILLRGVYKFITLADQPQYLDWLSNNAQASYDNRTNDLPSAAFDQKLSNGRATGVASGLAAMTYALAAQQHSGRLEAENALHYVSARNQSSSTASNGQLAGSIDVPGSAIEFKNVAAASSLTFSTASERTGAKLGLYINGDHVQDVAFPTTGSWTDAFAETTVPVAVPDGATLRIQFDDGDVPANIDYIDLNQVQAPDTQRPQVTLESPTTAGPFPTLAIKVNATDDVGLKRIVANIYQAGSLLKSTQTAIDGATTGTHTANVTLPDGDYSLKYNAQDAAGNVSQTYTAPFTIDATAPTVTVKKGHHFTVATGETYDLISLKLHDAGTVDKVTLNGEEKDLSDNSWSDLNFIKPGAFGAKQGVNDLVVFDVAGNTKDYQFTLN
ncbi:MAG TPA: glycoside hydrolase family 76 protein [Microbacteriaceae bacterium]|nr:glycoside hydrolase family 76 protein [Microbacteriaceae bacterium]